MVKTFGNIDSVSISSKDLTFTQPESVELESDEAEMYGLLFDHQIESPIEVRKPLQKSLRKFVDEGLLENDYHRFVKLSHKAINDNFDSVKKDGLHIINNEGDASLICAETKPEWKVVCTLERGTVLKFYKHKNHGVAFGNTSLTSATSTGTVSITNSSHTVVPPGFEKSIKNSEK